MILPSTAIQFSHDSSDKLTIIQPGSIYVGTFFLVLALLGSMIWMAVLLFANIGKGKASFLLFMMSFISIFYFVSYVFFTAGGTAVLSMTQNTLTTKHNGKTFTYPLRSVQQAIVQTADGGSSRMVFVMNNGQVIPIGNGVWEQKEGAYAAAKAVNSFLLSGAIGGTSTTPSTTVPQVPDWENEMQRKSDLQVKEYQERLRKEKAGKEQ